MLLLHQNPLFSSLAAKFLTICTWSHIFMSTEGLGSAGCLSSIFCGGGPSLLTIDSFCCASSSNGAVQNFWMSAFGAFVVGGTGSFSLLLTLLCIKFQDTNSKSLPKHKPKVLDRLFKPGLVKRREGRIEAFKRGGKGTKKSNKKATKRKHTRSGEELAESVQNFYLHSSTTRSNADDNGVHNKRVGNGVNTALLSLYENLLKLDKNAYFDYATSSIKRRDKRKSDKQGVNANEFPPFSVAEGESTGSIENGSWLRNVFMTQTDEEALRRKILERVEELDPLMCLPKVLCGYSNRRRLQQEHFSKTTTTSTTSRPASGETLLDQYLQLLKIVGPSKRIQKVSEENQKQKKLQKSQKGKKQRQKSTKTKKGSNKIDSKKTSKKKKKKKKSATKVEHEDDLQSGSDSSSSEESDEDDGYEPYPETTYLYRTIGTTSKRPSNLKTLETKFKSIFGDKKRTGKDSFDDDFEENDDFQDDLDQMLDDDDKKYLLERHKMEKLMSTNGPYSEENWWNRFEPDPVAQFAAAYSNIPPGSPYIYDPLRNTDDFSGDTEGGGLTKWFSNMLGSYMPSFAWGGNDAFKNDPFFSGFRSMKNKRLNEARSLSGNDNRTKSLPTLSALYKLKSRGRSGKGINLEELFGVQLNSRQMDYTTDEMRDPGEKFRIAVEIGRRLSSPSQCGFIYNGCPLSYEEILTIINEPVRLPTKTTTTRTTTSTTPSPTPAPTKRRYTTKKMIKKANLNFPSNTQSFVTLPSPIVMMPVQQQPAFQPYQPAPQQIILHQQQQPLPQYHPIISNQPAHLYNQQFQQQQLQTQLQYLQQLSANHQSYFQQQGHHILSSPASTELEEEMMVEVDGGSKNEHQTKILHALPSGEEFEINLKYGMGKSDLLEEDMIMSNTISDFPGDVPAEMEDSVNLNKGVPLSSASFEQPVSPQSTSASVAEDEHLHESFPAKFFNGEVSPHVNKYEFTNPSKPYKVRRKNDPAKESIFIKSDIKRILGVSGNDTSAFVEESEPAVLNNTDVVSDADARESENNDEKTNSYPLSPSSPEQIIKNAQPPLLLVDTINIDSEGPTTVTPSPSLTSGKRTKGKAKNKKQNKKKGVVTSTLPPHGTQSSSVPPSFVKSSPSSLPVNLETVVKSQKPTKTTPQLPPHSSQPNRKGNQEKGNANGRKRLKGKHKHKKKASDTKMISTKGISMWHKPKGTTRKKANPNRSNDVDEDDNSSYSSNSRGGNSSDRSSSSNEHSMITKKTLKRQMARTRLKKLQQGNKKSSLQQQRREDPPPPKRKQRKPHLHKQSFESESTEAEKRPAIPAANAIYPVYGQRFPSSYYHTKYPTTPAPTKSPSFFSYFFGR